MQPNKQGGQGEGWERIFIEDFQKISKATISQHSSKLKGGIQSIGFSILNLAFKHFSSWNSVSGTNLGGCTSEPDDSGLPKIMLLFLEEDIG